MTIGKQCGRLGEYLEKDINLETYYSVLYSKFPMRKFVESIEEAKDLIESDSPNSDGAKIQKRRATPWVDVDA